MGIFQAIIHPIEAVCPPPGPVFIWVKNNFVVSIFSLHYCGFLVLKSDISFLPKSQLFFKILLFIYILEVTIIQSDLQCIQILVI